MNALTRALAESQRSYLAAKAAVGQQVTGLMATAPSGLPHADTQKYATAQSQLDAFTSWVFAAIRPICNRIAAQPIRVGKPNRMRTTKDRKDVVTLDEHPILTMFGNPNNLQTGYGLLWALVASLNLTGRAFLFVPENVDPPEAYMIPPSWVKGHEGTTGFTSWKVQPPGHAEIMDVPADRVVYFAFPSPADPWGAISPLQAVASAVNNDIDILKSQRAAFARGIHPTHAIIVGKDANGMRPRLTDAQQRQLIGAILKRYSGTSKHGEPLIVDGLIEDLKPISLAPSEMDWVNSSKDVKARILEAFGVSPYILGSSEPGSRAASFVAEMHFIRNTVNPTVRLMNASLSEWLSPMFSAEGERLEVWIEECTVDDAEMGHRWALLLGKHEALTKSELRALSPLGLPEDSQFDGAVTASKPQGAGQEEQKMVERINAETNRVETLMAKAMSEEAEAYRELKRANDLFQKSMDPERVVDEILESVESGNGRGRVCC